MKSLIKSILNNRFLQLILVSLILTSCASMKSGKYIYVKNQNHMNKLIKEYKSSKSTLSYHNPDKKIAPGNWIFFPEKIGIAYMFKDSGGLISGNGEYIWPVPSSRKISSYFGKRGNRHHDGIDIPARIGSKIVAVKEGRVIYSGQKISGYGKMVIIKHNNGTHTVYAHNSKNFVDKGELVSKGSVIGLIGNSGRSTGPHLHFEIRRGKSRLNPMHYFDVLNRVAKN